MGISSSNPNKGLNMCSTGLMSLITLIWGVFHCTVPICTLGYASTSIHTALSIHSSCLDQKDKKQSEWVDCLSINRFTIKDSALSCGLQMAIATHLHHTCAL